MSEDTPRATAGVLLAAGRARRMGTTKQLLAVPTPAGGRVPMVVAAYDLLAPSCSEGVVVVTGHDAGGVVHALGSRAFLPVASDPDADMLVSVKAGLGAARRAFPRAGAVWLHLADHPFVDAATLRVVARAFADAHERRAVMPVHAGRGGHPALIPAGLVDEILTWDGAGGLRAFWVERPERCVRIEVPDPGVTRDLDTPEQYRQSIE
jgi:molybdenum cofactor cytidylyltransferase